MKTIIALAALIAGKFYHQNICLHYLFHILLSFVIFVYS